MAGLEGRTLNRYKLRQILGRGGMADVYVGYDTHFDREVAVKVFKREDEDLLRRFVREAQLMASMNNPHLIPVYDSGTTVLDGVNLYYIVMPLMEGGTLRSLVRSSPISLQDACHYLGDLANALDYIHRQGIVHRDIKSSNVLLDAEGRCYLSDFGIARALADSTQLTATGNVLGTVDYMAPELFDSDGKADARSDFYSLGILLYEMVTGALPFTAESQIAVVAMHVSKRPPLPRTFVPDISPQVERVLLKALEKRPELRYQSATELAQAFCQATQMPAEVAQVTNPVWGQLPADPVAMATARAQSSAPAYYSAPPAPTTGYAAFASAPIAPMRTPVRREQDAGVRTQTIIVTILALLALVAIIVPVSYVIYNQHAVSTPTTASTATSVPGATPNLTTTAQVVSAAATATATNATATVQAGVTATAQARAQATAQVKNATATAQAGATATAAANVSATAGVVQTATAGNPEYQDTLLNKGNPNTQNMNWDQTGNCVFKPDGYHATAPSGLLTVVGCGENARKFQNFALKVDVSIVNGHSGGVFFHETPTTSIITGTSFAGYLFEIDSNGRYKVSSSNNFNQGDTPLQDWTSSSALKTGSATNTLQIIAHAGGNFLFYINGAFVFATQDNQYGNGNIGFLASAANIAQTTDVLYTNLSVYAA